MTARLHEKTILITREEKQAKELAEKIASLGGKPIEIPLLDISCKKALAHERILSNLSQYEWIFFTSANGVRCFFSLLKNTGMKTNQVDNNIAVVGTKTALTLSEYGIMADFIPSTYNAETMTREFLLADSLENKKILLIRGNWSRKVLPDFLKANRIAFDVMEVYETAYRMDMKENLNWVLKTEKIDFVTFTSPSCVNAFCKMKDKKLNGPAANVCIGSTTANRAAEAGLANILTPEEYTIDGMLELMADYIQQKG